ncbi:hypothetical protein ATCC90586_003565 [Pythium insidiosum]|nr:hypothetical protein ATCC90586_003565 [Pythium insidiosum]
MADRQEDVIMAQATASPARINDPVSAAFAKLYTSRLAEQDATEELQALQAALSSQQSEYLRKQVMQNVMEKLMQIESAEELQAILDGRERTEAELQRRRDELDAAVHERRAQLERVAQLVQELEQEKQKLLEHEQSRPAYAADLDKLTAEWKDLQKRNAQRKAAIQMSTGMMINDEEDCARILAQQTQSIQQLHEQQKRLEERKMDLTTHVKATTEQIAAVEKQNEIRSKDIQLKEREEDCATLRHMKDWYQQMNALLTRLSGIDVVQITNDYMELRVLASHAMRLFFDEQTTRLQRVELLQADVNAEDLIQQAVQTNQLQPLLYEYRERVRAAMHFGPADPRPSPSS